MKKNIMVVLFTVLVVLTGCADKTHTDISKLEEISLVCDAEEFDYLELYQEAPVIAKIEVLDDLTAENSFSEYTDLDGESYLISAIAKRKVKILEYYKNDNHESETEMEIIEGAAIVDNIYYHDEGYTPLEKGKVYIAYLNNDTASGEYSLISGCNGLVDMEEPLENEEYADVSVKTLVEYESDLPEKEKNDILNSNIEVIANIPNDQEKKLEISVDNGDETEDIQINYQKQGENLLIEK